MTPTPPFSPEIWWIVLKPRHESYTGPVHWFREFFRRQSSALMAVPRLQQLSIASTTDDYSGDILPVFIADLADVKRLVASYLAMQADLQDEYTDLEMEDTNTALAPFVAALEKHHA